MKLRRMLPVVILSVHSLLLGTMSVWDAPTWDEIGHLPAGISHWQLGRFDLYKVNPPLGRLVAAPLPILAGAKTDWSGYSLEPADRTDFTVGRHFVEANGSRSFWLFTLGRWACIPFSWLGAVVCFCWARRLFGYAAGLLAMTFWCFSPDILAWGHTIMPDVPAAALGAFVFYRFWRWLKERTWLHALTAGIVMGLCLASKGTWCTLFILLPLLWSIHVLLDTAARGRVRRQVLQLASILLLGLYVLNLIYGFEGSFSKLKNMSFVSQNLTGQETVSATARPGNRFQNTWMGEIRVPLPRNYVEGIDWIKWEFEHGYDSFLRGEWKKDGWWYYYLYALAIKVPLGFWALTLMAAIYTVVSTKFRRCAFDEIYLLFPAVFILVLASSQTGINHHLRYVLPAYPFVMIWTSKLAIAWELRMWKTLSLVALMLAWTVASSLLVYPHLMSYFNELVGGPRHGYKHLNHSNVDFGQDLLYVKKWQEAHPQAQPFYFSTSVPLLDPIIAGIIYEKPPTLRKLRQSNEPRQLLRPGWIAISTSRFNNKSGSWSYLESLPVRDMIGYSVLVFQLTDDDVDRILRRFTGQQFNHEAQATNEP